MVLQRKKIFTDLLYEIILAAVHTKPDMKVHCQNQIINKFKAEYFQLWNESNFKFIK